MIVHNIKTVLLPWVVFGYLLLLKVMLPHAFDHCTWYFVATANIIIWMVVFWKLWLVRRPLKLQGYKPPPELLKLLPAEPGKKSSGDKIGVHHPDFAKVCDRLLASQHFVYISFMEKLSRQLILIVMTGSASVTRFASC